MAPPENDLHFLRVGLSPSPFHPLLLFFLLSKGSSAFKMKFVTLSLWLPPLVYFPSPPFTSRPTSSPSPFTKLLVDAFSHHSRASFFFIFPPLWASHTPEVCLTLPPIIQMPSPMGSFTLIMTYLVLSVKTLQKNPPPFSCS